MTDSENTDSERTDLADALKRQRHLLRRTVGDLPDEEAAQRPTADPLCLGDLIKEATDVELGWTNFALAGIDGMLVGARKEGESVTFEVDKGETVADVLKHYSAVASRTDDMLVTRDLDDAFPLPNVPGIPPGTTWSARRAVLEVIAMTAQFAARADRIRLALDDARRRAATEA